MIRLVFIFINFSLFGIDHPLDGCEKKTLFDVKDLKSSKESELDPSELKETSILGDRLISSISMIHDQDNLGACVNAALDTEINYLLRRTYHETHDRIPWTLMQASGKVAEVFAMKDGDSSLKELKEKYKTGGFIKDNFEMLQKLEQFNLDVNKRGLCTQPFMEAFNSINYSATDRDIYYEPFEAILFYLDNDKNLDKTISHFPGMIIPNQCEGLEKDSKFSCILTAQLLLFSKEYCRDLDFKYLDDLKAINLRLIVDEILKDGYKTSAFNFLPIFEAPLNCEGRFSASSLFENWNSNDVFTFEITKKDGSKKTIVLHEDHPDSIRCRRNYPLSQPKRIDKCITEALDGKCSKENQCREMFDFLEDAISNENLLRRRPITFAADMRLVMDARGMLSTDPSSIEEGGGHAMVAVGTASCEKNNRKCILIQNSWGNQEATIDDLYLEDYEELIVQKNAKFKKLHGAKESIEELETIEREMIRKAKFPAFNILPYEIKADGKMDYSRFWACGEKLLNKHVHNFNYLRPAGSTSYFPQDKE